MITRISRSHANLGALLFKLLPAFHSPHTPQRRVMITRVSPARQEFVLARARAREPLPGGEGLLQEQSTRASMFQVCVRAQGTSMVEKQGQRLHILP